MAKPCLVKAWSAIIYKRKSSAVLLHKRTQRKNGEYKSMARTRRRLSILNCLAELVLIA